MNGGALNYMPSGLEIIIFTIIAIVVFIVAFILGIMYRKKVSEREIQSAVWRQGQNAVAR